MPRATSAVAVAVVLAAAVVSGQAKPSFAFAGKWTDGATRPVVSKATWEGDRLKIVTTTPMGEEVVMIYREGPTLVREQISPAPAGRPAVMTKTVYTKS